jgi:hypothetical protein
MKMLEVANGRNIRQQAARMHAVHRRSGGVHRQAIARVA